MKTNIVALAVLFFLSLFLISCGGEAPKTKSKIFKYNQPNPVTSLDPAFARNMSNIWAVDHLFNGLVQLDEGLNIQPAIAKSWTISEDGLTYTFKLRDDVLI